MSKQITVVRFRLDSSEESEFHGAVVAEGDQNAAVIAAELAVSRELGISREELRGAFPVVTVEDVTWKPVLLTF